LLFQVRGRGRIGRRRGLGGPAGFQLGQPEVQDLGLPVVGDKQVGRLDIAVDDALLVRGIQRIGDLDGQLCQVLGRQRPAQDPLLECATLQQLHGDEVPAVGFVDVVNGANIGVVQRRGGARLALEAFERVLIARKLFRQELQRHLPAELQIFGLVNDTHPPAPELFENAIMRDGFASHGGPGSRRYGSSRSSTACLT
jgi:hypothetical protein